MNSSPKGTRVAAAILVIAAHFLVLYLVMARGTAPAIDPPAPRREFVVSLIDVPPAAPMAFRILIKPKGIKLHLNLARELSELHINMPAEPTASSVPSASAAQSTEGGPIDQAGGPATLTVIHYVAPIYPPQAARREEHGELAMALLVDAAGNVGQVKILSSTGSSLLDKAGVNAVRQWGFEPLRQGARAQSVWATIKLAFDPPQHLMGVPVIVIPYAAVAQEIEIGTAREMPGRDPPTMGSLRRLLQRLISASRPGHRSSPIDWPESQLGLLGAIKSMRFLGFVDHGIDLDRASAPGSKQSANAHWQVYDVHQNRGSALWLVATTGSGSIERIEVAVR